MNIWDAYCKPAYYNIYFDLLVFKGMSRKDSEFLKDQYTTYLQRIKSTIFSRELKNCCNVEDFKSKLVDIFENKWKNHIQYKEMPDHYYAFLTFLESIEALHDDFINEEEKKRLVGKEPDIPIKELTSYELNYLCDGKLVALMNPQLLRYLKLFIEKEGVKPSKAATICQTFYGDLLPQMGYEDYAKCIEYLWDSSHRVKKGGKKNKIKIVFPDNTEETLPMTDALIKIIKFYGVEEVRSKKIQIRNNDLILRSVTKDKEKIYEHVDENFYLYLNGDLKDRLNVVNRINLSFNKQLKIELV